MHCCEHYASGVLGIETERRHVFQFQAVSRVWAGKRADVSASRRRIRDIVQREAASPGRAIDSTRSPPYSVLFRSDFLRRHAQETNAANPYDLDSVRLAVSDAAPPLLLESCGYHGRTHAGGWFFTGDNYFADADGYF